MLWTRKYVCTINIQLTRVKPSSDSPIPPKLNSRISRSSIRFRVKPTGSDGDEGGEEVGHVEQAVEHLEWRERGEKGC
jgi:hypothetical protein